MTTSRTTSRVIIILLFLAGLLLLRKPVFGQPVTAASTHASANVEEVQTRKVAGAVTLRGFSPGLSSPTAFLRGQRPSPPRKSSSAPA